MPPGVHAAVRSLVDQLDREGWCFLRGALSPEAVEGLRGMLPATGRPGVRGLAARCPGIVASAITGDVRAALLAALGEHAGVVRSILFDKSEASNWGVAWHRDQVMAFAERADVPGFGAWSLKDGVPHARPPWEFISGCVTARVHLDDTPADNGALYVRPGSHRTPADEAPTSEPIVCEAQAGDVLLLGATIEHASDRAERPSHRRVIQLECCGAEPPPPLRWAEWTPLGDAG